MKNKSSHEKSIPNPALNPLKKLVGEWKTVGTHPYVTNTIFHGHSTFEWIEGGAFLILHSDIDEKEIPSGIAIFGSDDATGEFFMLYFDERKVSRKYEVSVKENIIKWWRNVPGFSQRNTLIFDENYNTIISKGELSKDGKNWEDDLELTYIRIK